MVLLYEGIIMKKRLIGVIVLVLLIVLATGCSELLDQQPSRTESEVETIAEEFGLANDYTIHYIPRYIIEQGEMPSGISSSDESSYDEINWIFTNYTLPPDYGSWFAGNSDDEVPSYIGIGSVFSGTFSVTEIETSSETNYDIDMRVSDPRLPGGEVTVEMEVTEITGEESVFATMHINGIEITDAEQFIWL
jgi:hypothetical protein